MITTLEKIRSHQLSKDGWEKLLRHLGKTAADDEPLPLEAILDSNGLPDALWCLRAVEGHDREIRLYAVWVARRVQHLMTDPRSISALDVAERFARGQASDRELTPSSAAASAAAWAAWASAWASASEAASEAEAAASAAAWASWASAWASASEAASEAEAARVEWWAARAAAAQAAAAAKWAAQAARAAAAQAARAAAAQAAALEAQAAEFRRMCGEIKAGRDPYPEEGKP